MKIGIIGSGNIGSALAKHLRKIGHEVVIANSRGPSTLAQIAIESGAIAVTVEQAAHAADIVIITVPMTAVSQLPKAILSASTAIIIDTCNYYPSRDGKIAEIDSGMAESEWVSQIIGHKVVKAFNNIIASSLISKGLPSGSNNRIAISVAGDNSQERESVMKLINAIGFDAVDAGTLAESWRQQPGTPAYCQDLNVNTLKSTLQNVHPTKIVEYRALADEAARPYFKK